MKQPTTKPYPIPGDTKPVAEPKPTDIGESALDLIKEIYKWTHHKNTPWAQRAYKLLKSTGRL